MIDFSQFRSIDLTLPYDEQIAGFSSETARDLKKDGWNARWLKIYSHAGTHIDAPLHFGMDGTIDAFTPSDFMGKAWVIDLTNVSPSELLEVRHLENLADQIQAGDSLILKTGWSKYLNNRELYRNQLPRISAELAKWMVVRKIKMLGVEPPSVADVNNLPEVTEIHEILLSGNVIIIEGLTNLDAIRQEQVFLIALPLKIKNGDGAPARVIALESK
ncbi:MAG: cyclase family protein [Bacteroidota bacterium]